MTSNSKDVELIDTHGQLPPLWSRKVTFFANLLSLFFGNEEQTQALKDIVGEIDSYGGRLIPILNLLYRSDDNLLILEREPDETLCRYLRDDLGLSLPRIQVMQHSEYVKLGMQLASKQKPQTSPLLEALSNHGSEWLDGYVTDEVLARIAKQLGCQTITSTASSRDGNNKLLLHQHQVEQGLPAFETVLAECSVDIPDCIKELAGRGYRSAVLRSQIGASGIGMLRIRDLNKPETHPDVPDYFFHEGPCLVQGWLEPGIHEIINIRSPSTQLFLDDDNVYVYDMTEQLLSPESIHQGNESPPPYLEKFPDLREETIRQANIVGKWLHQTGYRGTASIDWLVVEKNGKPTLDVYVCEINARVTGATYPSLLSRHFFPTGAWLLRNLRLSRPITSTDLLQMFEKPKHLFHPDQRTGIIPLNLNFGTDNLVHKGQFLCIGETTEQCYDFLNLAERDLPIQWNTDRD
ncbi:MAG: hypothetical protein JKY95_16485 [Planctomycetaceae bacterium]|nr:hypothetical protein [Planctomycetaceae bacterium]